jgi:hypothetical protein
VGQEIDTPAPAADFTPDLAAEHMAPIQVYAVRRMIPNREFAVSPVQTAA